jgi:DNA recombination protein RmuC
VKLRGTFGEELLEKLLVDVLPEEYVRFQYPVNPHSNEKVDAVVIYKDKVIPIDSKFNIEKFLQYEQATNEKEKKKYEKELLDSIQQQIDSISEKYVLPQYGSEYAFMYIPSEAVFLKIMNLKIKDDSIIKYAAKKRVIISSPQTLLPYLQFIVTGLKTEQISKNVSILIKQLHALLNSLEKFKENFSVVGKHIKNAYERYIDTEKELAMLDTQLKGVASIDVKTNLQELPEKQKDEF